MIEIYDRFRARPCVCGHNKTSHKPVWWDNEHPGYCKKCSVEDQYADRCGDYTPVNNLDYLQLLHMKRKRNLNAKY